MTYDEAMLWASYRQKYGVLCQQRRLELISAAQMLQFSRAHGGEAEDLKPFMVVTPVLEEPISLEDAMANWL
jgi:hypothetical protein